MKSFKQGLTDAIDSSGGAIGSAVGGLAGDIIGNGYSSGAGDIMGVLGDAASVIPGQYGMFVSAGFKTLKGITNALVGTKVNQEALNKANQGTDYLSKFVSNASSFDDVTGPMFQQDVTDAYKGGLFNKGNARRKNAELRRARMNAQAYADRSVDNNVQNLMDNQVDNILANYAALGGQLHSKGAMWSDGIKEINNGGTHESNPLEGVPMGVSQDGTPNLVEEGEVIFKNYVFSNRLKVPKSIRNKYKLRGKKEMTFADAAKKEKKELDEMPNDPIAKKTAEDSLAKLQRAQEEIREQNNDLEQAEDMQNQVQQFAEGGKINIDPSKKGTFTAEATKHDMSVQEFADEVLNNPNKYSPKMRKKAQFAKNAKSFKHAYGGLLNYFATGGPLNLSLGYKLKEPKPLLTPNMNDVQGLRIQRPETNSLTKYLNPDPLNLPRLYDPNSFKMPTLQNKQERKTSRGLGLNIADLRYAPAIGAGISAFSDLLGLTNKPDYSAADKIEGFANTQRSIRYNPIGNYLRYTPLDRLFYANKLESQAGATRRGILNSGLNRGAALAGLIAADYNTQNQLGNLYRQGEEYNQAQKEKVATFNRATDMFNAENLLKTQMANKDNDKYRLSALTTAAQMRDAIDARVGAARSANLTNFFENLGNIGREAFTANTILSQPGLYYTFDKRTGNIKYKNGYEGLSDEAKAEVQRDIKKRGYKVKD